MSLWAESTWNAENEKEDENYSKNNSRNLKASHVQLDCNMHSQEKFKIEGKKLSKLSYIPNNSYFNFISSGHKTSM